MSRIGDQPSPQLSESVCLCVAAIPPTGAWSFARSVMKQMIIKVVDIYLFCVSIYEWDRWIQFVKLLVIAKIKTIDISNRVCNIFKNFVLSELFLFLNICSIDVLEEIGTRNLKKKMNNGRVFPF